MGSSAQTMEYAYDDFCGYQLAKMVGNKHYQEVFARQMYNYKNVFDKSIGFMRGKGVDGKWQEPFDPLEWGGLSVKEMHGIIHGQCSMMYKA